MFSKDLAAAKSAQAIEHQVTGYKCAHARGNEQGGGVEGLARHRLHLQALVGQARARREDAERATRAELTAWLQQWHSHEQRLRRHDDALLPLAQQRSAAALSAYAAGSGSLSAVLDARRNALQVHLERLQIEREIARVWAQIAFLMPQDGSTTPRTTP